jgi:EmrB/QacA subfamily drug resistance transporter
VSFLDVRSAESVKPGHVLLVNSLSAWTTAFMTTGINIALPSIQTEFRLSAVALGWLPLSYVLASAIFLLPFGRVGDRIGRRLLFLLGMVLFALSSVGLVLAGSYALLVVFRFTQGLGSAMIFSTSMAMVTLVYPDKGRGRAMGIAVAAAYVGMTTGPIVGGVIVHNTGWRNLFLVIGCIASFNVALDLWLLRRAEWKPRHPEGFDWSGSTIWAVALSLLLIGLSWLPLLRGLWLAVAGVAGLALFAWWEWRAREPIMVLRLFRNNRLFLFSNLTALISYASIWGYTYLMSLYLQFVKGLDAQSAGLVLIVGVALQCLVAPAAGRLSDRVDPRWVASFGMALCTLALLLLSFLGADTPYWYVVLALCLLGAGYGFFSPPNQIAIMGSVDRRYVGFASANMSTMRMIGMALSIAVATLVISTIVGQHDIEPADYPRLLTAIRVTFGLLTGISVLSVVASLSRGTARATIHPHSAG